MSDRVPDTVLTAHLAGEAVLLEMDGKRYFRLNETGQAIWRGLEAGRTRSQIAEALVADFEIDLATAAAEIDAFIDTLREHKLVDRAAEGTAG